MHSFVRQQTEVKFYLSIYLSLSLSLFSLHAVDAHWKNTAWFIYVYIYIYIVTMIYRPIHARMQQPMPYLLYKISLDF